MSNNSTIMSNSSKQNEQQAGINAALLQNGQRSKNNIPTDIH
jgi:hypothetical protein